MRDTVNIITISLVSLFFMALVIYFGLNTYKVDTTQSSMTEALRSSVIANTNYASRLNRGEYTIDEKDFESDFLSKFEHLRNVERENADIKAKFDYLPNDSGSGIKAVKAIVTVNGTTYRSNVVVSDHTDDGFDSK